MDEPAVQGAIRAVFQTMFDALDASGPMTEDKWIDFIAVLNATGRMLFGYPHLESREEDIFGALDEIADRLDDTRNAIVKVTNEAREVLDGFTAEWSLADPEQPAKEAKPVTHAPVDSQPAEEATEPRHSVRVEANDSEPGGPQTPNEQDEALFAVIRADPTISMAAAERSVGLAQSRGIQRMKLLDGYGTLPADIREWREARSKTRGVPKGVSSLRVAQETRKPPLPPPPDDGLTFEERRAANAKARSEETWRERHSERVQ